KLLLNAERLKGKKNQWEVAHMYDKALDEARKLGKPFWIAMGGLCASRFWETIRHYELSRFYFDEAMVGLNRWGAYEGAVRMKSRFTPPGPAIQAFGTNSSSGGSSLPKSEPANFQTLLKSFHAISQVMETEPLLRLLMKTVLENATANKAVFVRKERDDLFVCARFDIDHNITDLTTVAFEKADFLPQGIVLYAMHERQNVIANDPYRSGKFQYDEYIRAHRPASCVAIPIILEQEVQWVLYLENKEVITPLSDDTLQTLRLLLTQAAITFKNVSLYETLKRNEENLNKAQQIAHVGSWQYDGATEKIVWSAETYRIYELEPFSIPMENQWFFDHLHPDDIGLINDATEKAFSGERYYDVVHRIITSKGNIKIVHQRAEVYWENGYRKMSGTIHDVTESKNSEETISSLSQVVSQNPFTTIITDTEGKIEYVNEQCLKMTGYFKEELIGRHISMFRSGVHDEDFYRQLFETISAERSAWRGMIVSRIKSGALRDMASTIYPIFDTKKEISHFVSIQDDATERNIKDKLFLIQTRQAQMGEMLSMIAHQWRQPLAIMNALINTQRVKLSLERASMEDIEKSFDGMEVQIQHLSRTISDFRDFFKPDKKAIGTKSSTIVSKAFELVEHSLMNKNIRVEISHTHDEEYLTYENEMIQVILNLVKNAQDAFGERSIENPFLTVTSDQIAGEAVIEVEDNAGGIADEIAETLFAPYTSTKSETNGTGLGLYMSKMIIEEHCHGTISVQNTDCGAKFTIRLPIRI
ncbi:PAS domain S-box protein, partial [Sulfuricurvum sp.]|uniref:PAS domain S-box protein n=1 Tax=Sulfuricurvum sp. TaxID=2025608 RepID=UPI002619A394